MKKSILTILFSILLFTVKAQQTFTTHQVGSMQIGQPDFFTSTNLINATSSPMTKAVAISPTGKIATCNYNRVLIWDAIPTTILTSANVVVGQIDFTTNTISTTQSTLNGPGSVCFSPDGNKLIVADAGNSRVLIWNTIPTTNGQPADVVIGQPNFNNGGGAISSTRFDNPNGVFVTASGKLLITDSGNNRILVYDSIPTTNSAAASYVIGQNNFTNGTSGSGLNNFNFPQGSVSVTYDNKILIADRFNHRILIFDESALSMNGAFASLIIGSTGISGVSPSLLDTPLGAGVSPNGKIFIPDSYNNRVLVFNNTPTINSVNADVAIGQPDFFSSGLTIPTSQDLKLPYSIALDCFERAFVSDYDNNRVIFFGDLPLQTSNLNVSISSSENNICIGSTFTTSVSITNSGPDVSSTIILKTALPSETNFLSSSTATGTYTSFSGYWKIPTLAVGETATLLINGDLSTGVVKTVPIYATVVYTEKNNNTLANSHATANINLYNTAKPVITVTSSANPACSTSAETLTASGGFTYYWPNGSTIASYNLNPGDAGIFSVIGTDGNGCSSSATITQLVNNASPTADAGPNQTICAGTSISLSGSNPTFGAGMWSVISGTGTITDPTNPTTSVTGITPGTNTYRWTVSDAAPCIITSDDVTITSNNLPIVSLSTFSPVCFSITTYTLTGGLPVGGIYSGTDVIGDVLQTTLLSGNQTITYSYTDANTCINSASQTLFIETVSQISGVVNANGTAITNGNVYLLKYNNVSFMDTVQTFAQSGNNSFTFNNVGSGNYLILAKPTITGNNGAYNGNVSFWQDAIPFTLDCSPLQTFTIETTTLASLTTGNGGINGTVTQGPNYGSGKTTLIGDPIPGVDVSLEQNPGGIILANTQTDVDGKYQFTNVSDGNYTVLVDIPGSGMISSHTLSLAGTENWINLDYYVDSNQVYINTTKAPDVVGIATFKNSNISIYPNPVHNKLTISNALGINEVKITSITGVTVYSEKLTNEKNTEIDFSQMPIGVYLIELKNNNTNYRTKIIKQ